jgi:hypothetical protein
MFLCLIKTLLQLLLAQNEIGDNSATYLADALIHNTVFFIIIFRESDHCVLTVIKSTIKEYNQSLMYYNITWYHFPFYR